MVFPSMSWGVSLRVGLSLQVRQRSNPARFGLSIRSLTQRRETETERRNSDHLSLSALFLRTDLVAPFSFVSFLLGEQKKRKRMG